MRMRARNYVAIAIAVLLFIPFAVFMISGATSDSDDKDSVAVVSSPSQAPTEDPTPIMEIAAPAVIATQQQTVKPESVTQLRRPEREAAQRYWTTVIGDLAMAGASIDFGGEAVQDGDSVTAQRLATSAEKFADEASHASLNEPYGWDNISPNLYNAANAYKKAIGELKEGLAQDDSEKIAAALDDASSAGISITDATHDARIWYEQNGGKWSDIEDYPTAEKEMAVDLRSLAKDHSSQ